MGERDDRPTERVFDSSVHGAVEPPVVDGVDAAEWRSLIDRGRQQGSVHAEQVTHVLRHVELTGDVLDSISHTLTEAGISLDETVDEADVVDEPDDTPTDVPRIADRESDDADEHLLSRRRRRRVKRAAPRTRGPDVGWRADVPAGDRPGRPADG